MQLRRNNAMMSYLCRPYLFSASLFPSILDLEGDTGARAVLRGIPQNMGRKIPCKDKRFVFDVDTVDDYKELLSNNVFSFKPKWCQCLCFIDKNKGIISLANN